MYLNRLSGVLLTLATAFAIVTPAHAESCKDRSNIKRLDVSNGIQYVRSRNYKPLGRYQGLIYWQDNGLDAALAESNSFDALEYSLRYWNYHQSVYVRIDTTPSDANLADVQENIENLRKALRKGKKKSAAKYTNKLRAVLPEAPPGYLLASMERDVGDCEFPASVKARIQTYFQTEATSEERKERVKAEQRDAESAIRAAAGRITADKQSEINTLHRNGDTAAVDAKMRDYYPDYMVAYDGAKTTQGLTCMPAASPTATKAEVFEQYYRFRADEDYDQALSRYIRPYSMDDPMYRRFNALETAYAIHLLSRFGKEIVVNHGDVLRSLDRCDLIHDKACQQMREGETSYYQLMEYHKKRKAGDMTPLDRSKVPLLTSTVLTNFPKISAENWKAQYLGQCSLQHTDRDYTPTPSSVRNTAWPNPTVNPRECKAKYDAVYKAMTTGQGGKTSDGEVSWALQYENNKGKSCDKWPGYTPPKTAEPYGVAPPTLAEGLEEMARAISCSQQTYQCTYIGNGQESCSWVTKSVC